MPKAISHNDICNIAKMIREWPKEDALTWNNICLSAKTHLSYTPTRQALSSKPMLKNAYLTRKTKIKQDSAKTWRISRPRSMEDAIAKIERLQSEVDHLRSELSAMAEIAQRFIHNATLAGLTKQKLMEPLPKIHNR